MKILLLSFLNYPDCCCFCLSNHRDFVIVVPYSHVKQWVRRDKPTRVLNDVNTIDTLYDKGGMVVSMAYNCVVLSVDVLSLNNVTSAMTGKNE